jgi:hypothetical protein
MDQSLAKTLVPTEGTIRGKQSSPPTTKTTLRPVGTHITHNSVSLIPTSLPAASLNTTTNPSFQPAAHAEKRPSTAPLILNSKSPSIRSSHSYTFSTSLSVQIGQVFGLMNKSNKFFLEQVMESWLDEVFLERLSITLQSVIIIYSQILAPNPTNRGLQRDQNLDTFPLFRITEQRGNVIMSINITSTSTTFSATDGLIFAQNVFFFYQNIETTSKLVAMIKSKAANDPRYEYFTNINQVYISQTEESNSTSSASIPMRIIGSIVGGIVAAMLLFASILTVLVWRRRYVFDKIQFTISLTVFSSDFVAIVWSGK